MGQEMTDANRAAGTEGYEVHRGDCLLTIAHAQGFHWETIWNRAENADLRSVRPDPMVLRQGDRVFIPEKRLRIESAATEQRHRFVRKGIPAYVKIRLCQEGAPLAGKSFRFDLDGTLVEGTVDAEGYVMVPVPPDARRAVLFVGEGQEVLELEVDLGGLDPADTVLGTQQRLANLGLEPGALDGEMGPNTRAALRRFQKLNGLEPTGQWDETTIKQLKEAHGA
jgi:hypothetical protein